MLTDQERYDIQQELERRLGLNGFERKSQRRFEATAGLARALESGLVQEWERREPINRQRSISNDFVLPLLRSAMSGVFAGPALGYLAGDVAVGMWAFAAASGLTWLAQMISDTRLNWRIERLVGRDLDGDGFVGESPVQASDETLRAVDGPPTVSVEVKQRTANNHHQIRYASLPVSQTKLKNVAVAVILNKIVFSRRALSDILSQSEYEQLAQAMLDAGLLFALPGNRRELSAAGRALLRQLLPSDG